MKTLQKTKHDQVGMTAYGMMFLLVVIGIGATAAIKLGPIYVDNHVIVTALKGMQKDYASANMQEVTDSEIKGKLSGYFEVNMVDDELAKNLKITRDKQKVLVSVNYERRTGFMGNVDFVVVFKNEVDLTK